ncbi:Aste57867_14585 [Aphanomyces stellatus]|uniref:Aste57867_14585 protein n=1 Tax=Aphanomyces stellatus TaxID=120398 RepID=A0A485L225_9STRA|nr:hypothetical protein As57867_014531 [Aphanomyces stellatus]VFT91404.1 Aste57867_14585 [Aphanomyces stellatus]
MSTLSVLLSSDLFHRIHAFQDGIHLDVRPLKALEPVSFFVIQTGTSMTCERRAALHQADALLAPWYAAHGTSHIPCLFRWYKHTYDIVATHAAYSGRLEVLDFLDAEYRIGFFRDLPLWTMAAANGHVHVLDFLHARQYMASRRLEVTDYVGSSSRAVTWAVAAGHLAAVEWLHTHNIACSSADAQDAAAEFGQLEILQWLHAHGIGQLTTWAMDKAAMNDHLDVLAWLHDHTNATCTTQAMDDAARNGHLDILQWLHDHNNMMPTAISVHNAAATGHVDVLRWLLVHDPPKTPLSTWAIEGAAQNGHLEAVQLLHEDGWPSTTRAMDKAAGGGHLDIVQWLHEQRSEGCTTSAMDGAARDGHLEVVQWLHSHRTEGCTTKAMDRALHNGHVAVVWWLIENRPDDCADPGFESVVMTGRVDLVQWFFRHRRSKSWSRHAAIANARRFGHQELLVYLEKGVPDACPCQPCALLPQVPKETCCIQ